MHIFVKAHETSDKIQYVVYISFFTEHTMGTALEDVGKQVSYIYKYIYILLTKLKLNIYFKICLTVIFPSAGVAGCFSPC